MNFIQNLSGISTRHKRFVCFCNTEFRMRFEFAPQVFKIITATPKP